MSRAEQEAVAMLEIRYAHLRPGRDTPARAANRQVAQAHIAEIQAEQERKNAELRQRSYGPPLSIAPRPSDGVTQQGFITPGMFQDALRCTGCAAVYMTKINQNITPRMPAMMPAIANPLPACGFRRIWLTAMTPNTIPAMDPTQIIQPTSDEIREMTANVLVRTI